MELSAAALVGKTADELETLYQDILGKLPSRAPIYLPTERVAMLDRILGLDHVRRIYTEDLDRLYRPRLRALREKYAGQDRCFLIGNGPSLNKTDLHALKNEVTFAVNGFFLKAKELDWKPTFYIVEDHLVAEDRAWWINTFEGSTTLFPAYLGYTFPAREDTIFYNHRPRKSYPHGFDFSMEADKITYTGCTVTFSMMQIAAYLGFREIYLIGVDASYDIPSDAQEGKDYAVGVLDMKSDDPNHFDPDYFGKGFRWHDPQVGKMIEAYQEARRTLDGTPQKIINATVGGMLEVFERRSFQSLFPHARSPDQVERDNAAAKAARYPRLLVLDMTAMGNGTATGEIKATLLSGWPADRLLQIARHGKDGLAAVRPGDEGSYTSATVDPAAARRAVEAFEPDVVLYRPVPNVPWLHDFAMQTIHELGKPVMTWLMDDWPAELEQADPPQFALLDSDLRQLLEGAAVNLSISDKMSGAFAARYGTPFRAFANCVSPVQWPALRHHDGKRLIVRYSGGLAKNMTLESVLRVARAVETLAAEGHEISLEISTQPWWFKASAEQFAAFKHTRIETLSRSPEKYREWLAGADAVLIAYNHDPDTLRYVQYSLANKMPECLASGAVVVAHGPKDAATIEYLARTGASVVIENPSDDEVTDSLRSLMQAPDLRNLLARKARDLAFSRHNIADWTDALRATIVEAAATRPAINLEASNTWTSWLTPDRSPQSILQTLSGQLLLDPKLTLTVLRIRNDWQQAVDAALTLIPNTEPLRLHFERVLEWAKQQAPYWPKRQN